MLLVFSMKLLYIKNATQFVGGIFNIYSAFNLGDLRSKFLVQN